MLLCAGGLLVAIFVADLILAGIRPHVEQLRAGPTAWHWGQIGLTVVCNSLLFGLIYKALPKAPVLARGPGRRSAGGRNLGRRPATLNPAGDRQELTAYGVVGSFVAIMIWFYYISATIFLGAEFVRAVSQRDMPKK